MSEVNDQRNISGFIYMILETKDCVFKMSVFQTL